MRIRLSYLDNPRFKALRLVDCVRYLLAQHSDQVLGAILTMAGRRELLLARKVEDLRRRVFELADVMGRPDA